MKLDVNALRYLSHDEWRALTAVEIGQKNHEIVPTALLESIAKLKHGGTYKALCNCLKYKLVHHDASKYDGYRLTNLGYDFLAINTLSKRGLITSVGRQIGVGKESDLFEVAGEDGTVMALKLHRLGRTSFRAVKSKRDYLRRGSHYSWLYLSRLAAVKEHAFMKALGERGLPVPAAIDQNRHAVLMERIDGVPLVQVRHLDNPGPVYERMMDVLCDITQLGLVHCDYNEFNVMLGPSGRVTVIDFPQMVSTSHANAAELFDRDVECVMRFFRKKLNYWMDDGDRPDFAALVQSAAAGGALDQELRASGFNNEDAEALKGALAAHAARAARPRAHGADSGTSGSLEGDTASSQCSAEEGLRVACDAGAGAERLQADALASPPASPLQRMDEEEADTRRQDTEEEGLGTDGDEGAAVERPSSGPGGREALSAMEVAQARRRAQARIQQQRRATAARQAARGASRNAMKSNAGKAKKGDTSMWD